MHFFELATLRRDEIHSFNQIYVTFAKNVKFDWDSIRTIDYKLKSSILTTRPFMHAENMDSIYFILLISAIALNGVSRL